MRDLSSKGGFRPAQGLKQLTWPQIEQIDAMIDALCSRTGGGQAATALLTVINGHLRSGAVTELAEELVPNRR